MSFPNGSSAGLDGIRPQHLKDLIGKSSCDAGQRLLSEITRLCNFMFSGKIISNFTPFIYGASLCALSKKDGGIRPIAIGSTFRRLASKLGCYYLSGEISNYLKPKQLGFGTRSGCEAAVHSVRSYLTNYSAEVFLKIDVKNAFNSVERDSLLLMVNNKIPLIYPYLWQCYSSPSYLIYNGSLIYSQVGCQQGDPLGPAIFSLSIHPTIERLSSHLNVWYLDDGALGGSAETVLKDLETIIVEFEKIGLSLNYSKCELFLSPNVSEERKIDILKKFESLSPDIRKTSAEDLSLLGSLLFEDAMSNFFSTILEKFDLLVKKIENIKPHMALFLLRHCLWIPKLNYFLCCCPFWKFKNYCKAFDEKIQSTLEKILNIKLSSNSWNQASLQLDFGGLGIRSVTDLSSVAFLASIHSSIALIGCILSPLNNTFEIKYLSEALDCWKLLCPGIEIPDSPNLQRLWDAPIINKKFNEILDSSDHRNKIIEPYGLLREDGKRPDGITLIPWKRGRTLVWDVTCVDTLAATHLDGCSRKSGSAALSAEKLKHGKYCTIKENHNFGPWSPDAKELFKDISKLLLEKSGVSESLSYFQQRISIAIQRGNAASVLGTVAKSSGLEEVFYLFKI
jgi:hypothetical protein